METKSSLTAAAQGQARKRGLTLSEVAAFCQAAARADADPDIPVKATVGFRGQLQTIGVSS